MLQSIWIPLWIILIKSEQEQVTLLLWYPICQVNIWNISWYLSINIVFMFTKVIINQVAVISILSVFVSACRSTVPPWIIFSSRFSDVFPWPPSSTWFLRISISTPTSGPAFSAWLLFSTRFSVVFVLGFRVWTGWGTTATTATAAAATVYRLSPFCDRSCFWSRLEMVS